MISDFRQLIREVVPMWKVTG